MVNHLACVKINVKTHKTIRNCGLVYSIDRENLQLILWQEFVKNIELAGDHMFNSGEMVFQITLAALQ